MPKVKLFPPDSKKQNSLFRWPDVKTWLIRIHYNELLNEVLARDEHHRGNASYYNSNNCLALQKCAERQAIPKEVKKHLDDTKLPIKLQTDALKAVFDANSCLDKAAIKSVGESLFYPGFKYDRSLPSGNAIKIPNSSDTLDLQMTLNGLTVGSVIWLYNYERMGIFRILGALLDDYNYKGKYPVSGKLFPPPSDSGFDYPALMDMISTLYRLGIGSNQRDRISLYQRVLGLTLEGNTTVDSERNAGFKTAFDTFNKATVEFYKAKQLAQAIQGTSATSDSIRSSVATQTTIRDTIQVLQKNFEAFEYGRNRINTFLGIATVYATICLLRMLKDEIGVPRQYDDPSEFIDSAIKILNPNQPASSSAFNRFTIYDNCASYGYRLLTDIELAVPEQLTTIALGSTLDLWLNDIEGVVEGYNNALRQASLLETGS